MVYCFRIVFDDEMDKLSLNLVQEEAVKSLPLLPFEPAYAGVAFIVAVAVFVFGLTRKEEIKQQIRSLKS
jgi:hypothetical protein